MRSIQLRCTRLVVGLALSPVPLLAGASETANVYVQANGGLLSAPNLESASDKRQVTDPVFGVGGVGSAAAALADGYLKLSVTSINQYIGSVPNEGSANADGRVEHANIPHRPLERRPVSSYDERQRLVDNGLVQRNKRSSRAIGKLGRTDIPLRWLRKHSRRTSTN